jgi:hypothetical protein
MMGVAVVPMVLVASHAVFAAGSATVQYGAPSGAAGTVISAMESVAGTIRYILGATALVAFLVAALVNHMVHDQHAKDRAKEIMASAVVGLLIAAFAPALVNWIGGI